MLPMPWNAVFIGQCYRCQINDWKAEYLMDRTYDLIVGIRSKSFPASLASGLDYHRFKKLE